MGGNFTVPRVLELPVKGFLIGNSLVEQGDAWPDGDRSHGVPGILEFYGEHFSAKEPLELVKFLIALCEGNVRGHWQCPCGSGAIIRKCHKDVVEALQVVPRSVLGGTAGTILDWLKARRAGASRGGAKGDAYSQDQPS
jgi:hypothetical protein